MKKSFFLFALSICAFVVKAQVPAGYYNSAQGLTGYALKSELSTIITNGHTTQSYGALWTVYYTSDVDNYYIEMFNLRKTCCGSKRMFISLM